MPIIISSDATDREKAAAQTLADYLRQISGALFKVQTGAKVLSASAPGIVVSSSFKIPDLDKLFDLNDPTTKRRLFIALACWRRVISGRQRCGGGTCGVGFVISIGYRQFFPGKVWEVIPRQDNLSIAVDTFEHSDYYSRRIWPGFGNAKIAIANGIYYHM